MEFNFKTPPPLGYEHERLGNRYTLTGVAPYVREDGAASFVLTWRGHKCCECGAAFETKSGLAVKVLRRRCHSHKGRRGASTEEARKAMRRAGRAAAKKAKDLRRLGL